MLIVELVSCLYQVHRWACLGRTGDILTCSTRATARTSILLLDVELNTAVGLAGELAVLIGSPGIQNAILRKGS